MFPPIEPFNSGHLPVSDGHEIYWETSGNPKGRPALFLHGGPGGGIGEGYRRRFDPAKFLIISFEQRGCGRSRPLASESLESLSTNTTQKLIEDIEALRTFLKVEKWLVTGVSWGTTLAFAYAQAHTKRVNGLVLACVTTTTAREVSWITEGTGENFPQPWEEFKNAVQDFPGERLIDRYYSAITHPNPKIREKAAIDWCKWEDVHPSFDPKYKPNPDFQDPIYARQFATLTIHYWKNSAFLKDGEIRENINVLTNIPCVLIHGRLDISCPMRAAWNLHKVWPKSKFILIEDEGHGGPKIMEEMARSISKFA